MKSLLSAHAGSRILIVDDLPANLSVLRELLIDAGFRVFVAESGASALEQAPFARPDLILIDVMMPGMDGFEACRRLKALPDLADVPLFFMTALNETADKLRGFEAGAVDYIAKPFHPQEVLARIATHLEIRSLHRALAVKNAELEDQNERLDQQVQLRLQAEKAWARLFDRAILIVDGAGRVQFSTAAANALLGSRFPGRPTDCLPEALATAEGLVGDLRIQVAGRADDGLRLLVLEENRELGPEALHPLGLTPRESEVLFWIVQGKTSPEIAIILESNVHTVKKHVQNLLPKLGVENRIAAAMKAAEFMGNGGPPRAE